MIERMTMDAVIFDWGGTLTPWRDTDGGQWQRIAARLVGAAEAVRVGTALADAEGRIWDRSRDEHRSGTLAEVFAAAGVPADDAAYAAVAQEWEWATFLDPDAHELLAGIKAMGLRIGVLSNTSWTRHQHQAIFERDGVADYIDGAVYTSEIPWTKPHPEAFRAAMAAVGATDPARCVFVGDRPFDDIYGANRIGMRAVFLPHSRIPAHQHGHALGTPDATIQRLGELLPLLREWITG